MPVVCESCGKEGRGQFVAIPYARLANMNYFEPLVETDHEWVEPKVDEQVPRLG